MNSKLWIRKALSSGLCIAILATYSMVALANSERIAGEITVNGSDSSFVMVNGEAVKSGRSVFSSSTISTPDGASAIVNLGKAGKVELAPNTTVALSFDDASVNGDLTAGKLTVLSTSNGVNVKTLNGKTETLNAGQSVVAAGTKQDSDDDDHHHGAAWFIWAAIFIGASAGIIYTATQANNDTRLGGNGTVISPVR